MHPNKGMEELQRNPSQEGIMHKSLERVLHPIEEGSTKQMNHASKMF